MDTKTSRLYQLSIALWGHQFQMNMAIEEMAELIKDLLKLCRGQRKPEQMAEEVADVQIMLEQLIYMFDISKQVDEWKEKKLERLKELIDNRMKPAKPR